MVRCTFSVFEVMVVASDVEKAYRPDSGHHIGCATATLGGPLGCIVRGLVGRNFAQLDDPVRVPPGNPPQLSKQSSG